MKISPDIKQAWRDMMAAKLRTFLAALGILVGTASVVAMVSGGQLATREALMQLKQLGTNMMAVSINEASEKKSAQQELTLDKIIKLKTVSPNIKQVAPYARLMSPIYMSGRQLHTSAIGVTDEMKPVLNIHMQSGRFITPWDHYDFFCVIGQGVYKKIKQYIPHPLGKQLLIGNTMLTIVGVMQHWRPNLFMYADLDNSVMVPMRLINLIDEHSKIDNIVLSLKEHSDVDALQKKIKNYFSDTIPENNVSFQSAKELVRSMKKQQDILTIFLGFIGAISLLVGGIGVMNIMLVSVVERKREIGIRLAVGAKPWSIQKLFLLESVMLSLVGGMLGVIVGIFISFIIAFVRGWGFAIFPTPILLGFFVSVLVGIFFGYYPARKASKLNPIETLRIE